VIGALATRLQPLLLVLDPERAHELTLAALERGLFPRAVGADDPRLSSSVLGLELPNPIGIAAGFDKDARVPDALLAMGFGFAEVGTLTPLPQPGNPRPRIFRLTSAQAIVNRLGFNNGGHAAALLRLQRRSNRGGVVGVNIGANKDSADRAADYVAGLSAFSAMASYFMVNISSPNTPGLRDLQAPKALDGLLIRLMAERGRLLSEGAPRRPILVKLSPDVADDDLPEIVACLMARGIDGICVANTTLSRAGVSGPAAQQAGGLSGPPLFVRATRLLARVHLLTAGRIPLVGVGGIDSGDAALAKVRAGASLLQLYTGLVYRGPALLDEIKRRLLGELERCGARHLSELVGIDAEPWAAREL
jgi:dihydroorotate dehydrogenase